MAKNPNNPVGWFEIHVQDLPRAQKFYESVLGVELEKLPTPDSHEEGGLEMMAFPNQGERFGASGTLAK